MATTLTVLYPAMVVHAQGCADAAKSLANHWARGANASNVDGSQDFTADTVEAALVEVVADINDSGDWDTPWTLDDFKVEPCVRKGPKLAKPVPAGRCPGSGQPFNTEAPRWRGGRPMYDACPVCGHWYGTGRGVLPAHKAR